MLLTSKEMKKTRFIAQDPQQQSFAAAVRKNVQEYFKANGISPKANGAVVFQTLSMLGLYIAPFVLLVVLPLPWWIAIFLPIIAGIGLAGIGMCVMHGGAHEAISRHKWLNAALGGTMNILGNSMYTWKVKHNMLHHTYTNITGMDDDLTLGGPLRLSEHTPLHKIHRFQYIHGFFLYCLLTITMLVNEFTWLRDFRKKGILEKQNVGYSMMLAKVIVIKVLYAAVIIGLPIWLSDYAWWQVVLAWMVMHFTGGFIMGVVFQLAHIVEGLEQPIPTAEGTIHNDWVVHEMHTTADFAPKNKLLNWYIGGLNFQIEHHLFPNICHVHYPKIAPIVAATARAYGVPYVLKPTLWQALLSHARKLKELGSVAPAV
jgi:linoleoyl-CoA desaturase